MLGEPIAEDLGVILAETKIPPEHGLCLLRCGDEQITNRSKLGTLERDVGIRVHLGRSMPCFSHRCRTRTTVLRKRIRTADRGSSSRR